MFGEFVFEHSVLFSFFIIAVAGVTVGKLFHFIKLPDISGQVIVGILLGPAVFKIFSPHDIHELSFLTDFALGVMTFIAGTHLNLKKLHNSQKRLITLTAFDLTLTFSLVFCALYFLTTLGLTNCLLISSIAVSTAPGTIIGLIQSKKARGVLVTTLIGVVALNNVATIIIFEICKGIGMQINAASDTHAGIIISTSMIYIVEDIVIGICMGWILSKLIKHQHENSGLFSTVLLVILANLLICQMFPKLSSLLVNLATGAMLSNLSFHTKRVLKMLDSINGLIFAIFFTLAGTHLDLSLLKLAGVAGIVFVVARGTGKVLSTYAAGRIFNYPKRITQYLGLGLIPQAGLAVGLVITLSENPAFSGASAAIITTIVLASVAVNELIGPFTTAKSFDLAQESGQSPPRLVDFLHEEFILIPLKAKDKWDAIDTMCRFLVKTNHLNSITLDELRESVIKREKEFSTGLGSRVALPHARIPAKEHLMGVIGIAENPIEFESIDKKPVDIVILIATPQGREELHLKIVATVAKIFTNEPKFHDRLVKAENAAEVYDILQSKEVRDINYFIDENV